MRTAQVPVVSGGYHHRVLPQIEIIHGVKEGLEVLFAVANEIEIVIVEDFPHVDASGGYNAKGIGPTKMILHLGPRSTRSFDGLMKARRQGGVP